MKTLKFATAALVLSGATCAFAGTINFEVPGLFNQDVGGYYAGVNFSGDVLTTVSSGYPGNGSYNLLDSSSVLSSGGAPEIVVHFATPQTSISFLYASLSGIQVNTFDSGGNAIAGDTFTLAGSPGFGVNASSQTAFLTVAGISTIDFIDLAGIPTFSFEAIDDISGPGISGASAPDVSSTFALLGMAGFGLLLFKRKFAAC